MTELDGPCFRGCTCRWRLHKVANQVARPSSTLFSDEAAIARTFIYALLEYTPIKTIGLAEYYTHCYTMSQRRPDEKPQESGLSKSFLKAAANGQIYRVEHLHRSGATVEFKDECQMIALHHACFNGFEDTIEALIRLGADVHACSEFYGIPLCLAAIKGRDNAVGTLIDSRPKMQI